MSMQMRNHGICSAGFSMSRSPFIGGEIMDHQSFAQLLGSYGEFFGAVAVFATLAYLAVQVRQSTRSMQSQILLQTTQLFQGVFLAPTNSPPLLAAMRASREGRELEPEELVALGEYLYAYMHALATTAFQFELSAFQNDPRLRQGYLEDVRSFFLMRNSTGSLGTTIDCVGAIRWAVYTSS